MGDASGLAQNIRSGAVRGGRLGNQVAEQAVHALVPGRLPAGVITHRALWYVPGAKPGPCGIAGDTMLCMAMTLRLADDETEALRRRAELEQRSMQEVARQAIREYVENHSRAELLDQVLDEELPRYAEALERLGQ